ncbi:MAG: protein kinase [Acidobacteriota bacterium]
MPLSKGDRLGPYEILAPVGKGGMGEVYRAHDPRLRREVGIKISAERFNERFEREARAVAALNHPNICQIFDVGPNYLVMEFIEGPTLAQRIKEGPIPLEEALPIALQIAAALEAAHEKTITHRDLKPANVKIKPDGVVKVLDFGLAKFGGTNAGPLTEDSPTLSMAATREGMILGTPGYMAPEQVKGKEVDRRADVWAFGVVLYEMVTGQKLFKGDDSVDILAASVHGHPDLSGVPVRVRKLIARCLEKDPKKRLRDMHSVTLLLEDGDATEPITATTKQAISGTATLAPTTALPGWAWAVMGTLAIVALLSAAYALRTYSTSSTSPRLTASLTMDVSPADMLGPAYSFNRPSRTAFAISPDGATIVFAGLFKPPNQRAMLYRRPLSGPQAIAIPGTESAEFPFFSPDGQWVGFAAGGKLKKVALSGGPPIDLCVLTGLIDGASWGSTGVIAFSVLQRLRTVLDSGGNSEAPIEDDPKTDLYSPFMLPDGHTVLVTEVAPGKWEEAHVDAINVTTKQRKTVIANAADPRYSPTGHLVFMRDAVLLAVPFDADRVEVTGAPVPLLAGIMQSTNAPHTAHETGMGQFSLSASGTLVYASGGRFPTVATTLVRVDRKGAETKLAEIKGYLVGLRVPSDGSRMLAFKTQDGSLSVNLWMYELPSGTPTRLTSTGTVDWPLFSPDGKSILFRDGGSNPGIYSLALDGSNAPQRVIEEKPGQRLSAASWSPDAKWLAYLEVVGNVSHIFVRPVQDSKPHLGEARQFSPSTFGQTHAQFSPDGHWIAYASGESGNNEVYVQAFPGPGEKHRISRQGGVSPTWSPNGRELYFLGLTVTQSPSISTRAMMAVDLSTAGSFKASEPRKLFEGPYSTTIPLRSYDVTPNGQFIMMREQEAPDERVTKLNVVLGWAEELKRRVPTR